MFNDFDFDIPTKKTGIAVIKVIGVGGGGCNAVSRMFNDKIEGVEFIVANTDVQQLSKSSAHKKISLGVKLTKGLGAGANPETGKKAAVESEQEIKDVLTGADLVFVASGLGGGTGTGAAPVVAKIAKEVGALVVGVVTTPFQFEGPERVGSSRNGLAELIKYTDSYILISNERLLLELGGTPITESFKIADSILKQAVRTITDLIVMPSMINLDFADISKTIKGKGPALIGIGHAKKGASENLAIEAAVSAITSPILESSIEGAKYALVNITGGKNLTLDDANDAVEAIKEAAQSDIDIIFGVQINDNINDDVIVSVIATGLRNGMRTGFGGTNFSVPPSNPKPTAQPIANQHQRPVQRPPYEQPKPTFTPQAPKQSSGFIETLELMGTTSPKAKGSTFMWGSTTKRSPLEETYDNIVAQDKLNDDDIPAFMRQRKER